MKNPVEQVRGIGSFRRDSRNAGDVDVRTAATIEKFEVPENDLAVARQAESKPLLHRIKEQRLIALRAHGLDDGVARQRRHEDLRLHPSDHDMGFHCCVEWKDALLGKKYVAFQFRPFVPGNHHIDHAVNRDLAAIR